MKFLKENWSSLLTTMFLIVLGILLLVNPDLYSTIILQIAGILLAVLGIYDLIKYFRTEPEQAAKGSGFYSGAIMITAGIFCLFSGSRLKEAFPILAALYGVFQILLGYRKLQRMVDALRMKDELWWLKGISAGISLLFGFIIALNPEMKLIGIWAFTGLTLIIEGIFDAVAMVFVLKKRKAAKAEAGSHEPVAESQETPTENQEVPAESQV